MDLAGVRPLVEFVSHDAQIAIFDGNVARDGGQQLFSILIPPEERKTTLILELFRTISLDYAAKKHVQHISNFIIYKLKKIK